MRIALILWTLGVTWSLQTPAGEASLPVESSFIIQLADKAIDAEGVEAVTNRQTFRRFFADWFLISFAKSEGDLGSDTGSLSSRIMYRGGQAGHAYRIANPDSVERVMLEYGYEKYDVVGVYNVKTLVAHYFVPENANVRPVSSSAIACWHLRVVQSEELDRLLLRMFSTEQRRLGSQKRIRVSGYVGPVIEYEEGVISSGLSCERSIFAVSVEEVTR